MAGMEDSLRIATTSQHHPLSALRRDGRETEKSVEEGEEEIGGPQDPPCGPSLFSATSS